MHGGQSLQNAIMQAGMRLQPQQARDLVLARQRLLKQVSFIRQAREKIVMAFGLAVIQRRPVCSASTCFLVLKLYWRQAHWPMTLAQLQDCQSLPGVSRAGMRYSEYVQKWCT